MVDFQDGEAERGLDWADNSEYLEYGVDDDAEGGIFGIRAVRRS